MSGLKYGGFSDDEDAPTHEWEVNDPEVFDLTIGESGKVWRALVKQGIPVTGDRRAVVLLEKASQTAGI